MDAESVPPNENKLIQEWVDEEISCPYTPMDLGNRKYKQTIAQTGFTKGIIKELTQNGLTPAMIDKHIRMVITRFSFNIAKAGSRKSRYTPPASLPDVIFIEEKKKSNPPYQ